MVINGIDISEDGLAEHVGDMFLDSLALVEYDDEKKKDICKVTATMNKEIKLLGQNNVNFDDCFIGNNYKFIKEKINNIDKNRLELKRMLKDVYSIKAYVKDFKEGMNPYKYQNQYLYRMYITVDKTLSEYDKFLFFPSVLLNSLDDYYLEEKNNGLEIWSYLSFWKNINDMILAYFNYSEVNKNTYGYFVGKIMKNFDDYMINPNVTDYVSFKCRLNELTCLCRFVYTRKFNMVKGLFEKAMKLPMNINDSYYEFRGDLIDLI